MVYVKRRDRETTPSLLRRFTRRVQSSGVLIRARRTRFFVSKPTKRSRRERALKRLELLKERERLLKLGKLKETERRAWS
ncbi:MAG: 30S ribosomal protein S21 [Patescibacteria group bacterium]